MKALERERIPAPGPVRPFDVPAVERGRLDNGLELLCARHGDLPVVTVAVVLDAGAERDPPERAGLAQLTVNALETGAGSRSAEEVAWQLERLGIELHADAGWDAASLRATLPSDRLEPALELVAELVRRPSFPENEVRRLRDEQLAELMQRRKEPRALASDMAAQFIFGRGTTYARPVLGLAGSVERIERDAVAAFHAQHYRPGSAAVILVGDVAPEQARALTGRELGDWRGDAARPVEFDVAGAVDRTTISSSTALAPCSPRSASATSASSAATATTSRCWC